MAKDKELKGVQADVSLECWQELKKEAIDKLCKLPELVKSILEKHTSRKIEKSKSHTVTNISETS